LSKLTHLKYWYIGWVCGSVTQSYPNAGDLPAKKLRLVQAWIAIHEEKLMADWALAANGEPVFPIDPLR
jgi:hypothetical protein